MKRFMKQIILMLLIMMLATPALAAPGDMSLLTKEGGMAYVESMVTMGDTLYLMARGNLYHLKPGMADAESLGKMPLPSNEAAASDYADYIDDEASAEATNNGSLKLTSDGQQLYGLNDQTGELSTINWADGEVTITPLVKLDWSDMMMALNGGYPFSRMKSSPVILDGTLYVLRMDDDFMSTNIMAFDLASGTVQRVASEGLQYIATYKDGLLLGAQRKDNDYSKPLTMVNVDPRDGSTQPLFEMSSSDDYGIEYDAETDTIYYLSSGELYASIALGKPEVRSYLPLSNTWNGSPTALLPGGLYVVSSDNKTIVRNTDPAYKQGGALRINGLYYDMVANKFQEEYPDVPLVMTPDYYPTSEAYTSNMTSDAACDLYVLDLTGDIAETLAAKGYLGDLSTSETLRDAIAKMYPDISDALLRDGKLIAFPQRYEAHTYGYAPKTFEKVGLTEQDVPKTFAQLMQFIDRWEQELSAQFPEITLFNDQEDMVFKNTLFHEIMSTYVSQLRKNNQPIEFDTPVFKSLLEQLNKTDFSGFKQPDPDEEEGGGTVIVSTRGDEDFVPTALFTQYSTVTLNDYILNDGYETMPLSLSDDEPASIRGWLNAFVLNPNSKNIEQAMQFLEYYVNNMSGANKTNLMPDLKEKVESPYYQMQMDELVIRKNEAEDALAKAKGTSNESTMQLALDEINTTIDWVERERWCVTEQDIENYRAIHDQINIANGNLIGSSEEESRELSSLIQRFIDGQLSTDQFVQELDKKVNMMELEGR